MRAGNNIPGPHEKPDAQDASESIFGLRLPMVYLSNDTHKIFRNCNLLIKGDLKTVQLTDTHNHPSENDVDLAMDKPATYCIRVAGYLDQCWSNRLGGMKINVSSQEGTKIVSTLSGAMIDQAALFGVLKALYDMRLPLLSVECLHIN